MTVQAGERGLPECIPRKPFILVFHRVTEEPTEDSDVLDKGLSLSWV